MTLTLQELAVLSEGELVGDPALVIGGAASLAEAKQGEITFFANPKYVAQLRTTHASAVFVPLTLKESIAAAQIRVADPEQAFQQIALKFAPLPIEYEPMIHPSAVIGANVQFGDRVSIQPHAVIERGSTIGDDTVIGAHAYIGHECVIGAQCLIYPHATIRERSLIGARVIIHSGAVVGADGFGFEIKDGRHVKIPQIGIVQIDDDVEIGANTTIDRARFGRTWIQAGAKIDNLVQIAHNVVIGKHALIASQAGIAGSTRVGDYVMLGGQSGLTGHIEVGARVIIGAKAGVSKNIPPDSGIWWGIPATPIRKAQERLAWVNRLGQFFERVKALEEKLKR
ncbi:MAG: UDP-3-O-(3-hydroxymyristoyl)glucosamine N-acyltransferase [Chthoniobacterales bacterium]